MFINLTTKYGRPVIVNTDNVVKFKPSLYGSKQKLVVYYKDGTYDVMQQEYSAFSVWLESLQTRILL